MLKLPQYQCHKKVRAGKIIYMRANGDGTHTLDLVYPRFYKGSEAVATEVEVPASYMSQHAPEIGGWFVVYEDGYQSYSPAKAFEVSYTLIVDKQSEVKA